MASMTLCTGFGTTDFIAFSMSCVGSIPVSGGAFCHGMRCSPRHALFSSSSLMVAAPEPTPAVGLARLSWRQRARPVVTPASSGA